ncbi:MAG: hypothetical protein KGH58_03900 [Candidatus Micrarchaeota archaeon]|nr:hypothetical protein [Candidatus Micrarchaeota archaeon]
MERAGMTLSSDGAKKEAIGELLEKYSRNPGYRATAEDCRKLLRIYS